MYQIFTHAFGHVCVINYNIAIFFMLYGKIVFLSSYSFLIGTQGKGHDHVIRETFGKESLFLRCHREMKHLTAICKQIE